jgi:rubredoxin
MKDNMMEPLDTPERCLAAVRRNGLVLCDVPDKLKTPKLCQLAVQQDSDVFEYVPKEMITPELCHVAVQQDGRALRYVPEELKPLFKGLSAGGDEWELSNLELSCPECNMQKGSKVEIEYVVLQSEPKNESGK